MSGAASEKAVQVKVLAIENGANEQEAATAGEAALFLDLMGQDWLPEFTLF